MNWSGQMGLYWQGQRVAAIVSIVTCESTAYVCILLWARGWFVYIASLSKWVFVLTVAGSRRGHSGEAGISLVSRLYLQEHSGRWGLGRSGLASGKLAGTG